MYSVFNKHPVTDSFLYIVNLKDVKRGSFELQDGLKRIRPELEDHFSKIGAEDLYGTQMWRFVIKADQKLKDLMDEVNLAQSTFTEVVNYFGEDDKNMSSSEFYGIFKTFVISYKVCPVVLFFKCPEIVIQKCKAENDSAEEHRSQRKRLPAVEGSSHQNIAEATVKQDHENSSVLDNLLEKLRNGDSVGRWPRRARRTMDIPITAIPGREGLANSPGDDAAEVARDMLARLQSNGFGALGSFSPVEPNGQLDLELAVNLADANSTGVLINVSLHLN
jgi:cytokinesis protein